MGLIPELWSVNSLHEHLLLLTDYDANGSFADMANNVKTTWGNGFAWFVRATDLEQKSEMSVVKYTDKISYEFLKKSALFGKELLVAKRGEIGKVYYFQMKTQYATLGPNLYLLKLKETLNSNFLYWFFLSEIGQEKLKEINASTSLGAIYKDDVKKLKVPIPPLCEQEKIAEALSDMDNLISSLEKLIEKKKTIKQGAMQKLLTGKTRLPGFCGKIEYKPLKVLCEIFADGDWIESKDQSSDGIRLIQTGNIGVGKYLDKDDKQRFISEDTFKKLNCLEIFENDVLVSRLPEPAGRACILPSSSKRRITAVDCTIIRFTNYNPVLFVAYSQTKEYRNNVDMAMAGSTRQRISRKELGEIPIPVFPSKEEQDAIASILSDMDEEITALEQKLSKCQRLKQGMMQQLLTGKIRLI